MAFAEAGKNTKGRRILTETITQGDTATVYSDSFQVNKGEDFTVVVNTAAVNTTGAITTEVEGSHDNTTFFTLTSSFIADCDTATLSGYYDNSLKGDLPYYRLAMAAAADDDANDLEVVVII